MGMQFHMGLKTNIKKKKILKLIFICLTWFQYKLIFLQYNLTNLTCFHNYIKEYFINFNLNFAKTYDEINLRINLIEQLLSNSKSIWVNFNQTTEQITIETNWFWIFTKFNKIYLQKVCNLEYLITPKQTFINIFYYILDKSKNDFLTTNLSSSIHFQPFFYVVYDWIHCLILCLSFFIIGFISLIKNHKDILRLLISLEILFLSIIISFILTSLHSFDIKGYLIAMFLLAAVACESVIGLGLVINLFRKLKTALWYFLIRLRR